MNPSDIFSKLLDCHTRRHRYTRQQQIEFAVRAKRGDCQAAELLIYSVARFIIKHAQHLTKRRPSLDEQDLVQEGVMGCLHAVTKFEPLLGTSFLTYAGYWIRHYMNRYAAAKTDVIRGPIDETGKMPRIPVVSLQIQHGSDDDDSGEMAAGNQPTAHERLEKRETIRSVRRKLLSIPERDRKILRLRAVGFTCAEIGKKLGISPNRVSQIEIRGMYRLARLYKLSAPRSSLRDVNLRYVSQPVQSRDQKL